MVATVVTSESNSRKPLSSKAERSIYGGHRLRQKAFPAQGFQANVTHDESLEGLMVDVAEGRIEADEVAARLAFSALGMDGLDLSAE